jgi:solute carrier family 25 phosphate transporter 23/24/25/41
LPRRSLLIGQVTTYPLDLVRSRLSIATASISSAKGAAGGAMTAEDALLGIAGMTKKVYRTEGGLKGL